MTDLTELWKKGELPGGKYYTLVDGGSYENYIIIDFYNEYTDEFERHQLITKEVLAPVPTYKEYQASEKYIKNLEEKIKIYERKEKQHTKDSVLFDDISEAYKQCLDLLMKARFYLSQKERTPEQADAVLDLIDLINNMIGEN